MKLTSWATRTLILGAVAGMVGCAGTSPVATTDTKVLPQNGDRQVLSTAEAGIDAASFEQMFNDLPKFISEEDAKNLLVEIDPSQIQTEGGTYSVLRHGGRGGTWNRGDVDGQSFRSSSRGFHRSFGHGGSFRRFRFLNRGGFSFPYYYGLGGYYPFSYGGYYPYLYSGLGSLYNPYYYYNPGFTSSFYSPLWASSYLSSLYSWPGLPGASSVMQGAQQTAQPAQQTAQPAQQSTAQSNDDDEEDDDNND